MTRHPDSKPLRIGIDIGGTFTDFVVFDESTGQLDSFKLLSTPADPAEAVLAGLEPFLGRRPYELVHGSTVATNALLERKGARTAFIATGGFRDLLTIGRQTRQRLYDLTYRKPEPLVPEDRALELTERVTHDGEVLTPLCQDELAEMVTTLKGLDVESIAITFLFSFVNSAHEVQAARELRKNGWFVTASHELVPEFREYERASTTVVNAYVSPIVDRYLGRLEQLAGAREFHILQSNGGRIHVSEARRQGVRSILSGPAGGVLGAAHLASLAGFDAIMTFDMGGTSTDVAWVKGDIPVSHEACIDGMSIKVPVIDIHTVGAGGGSLAVLDDAHVLHVGPQSAGADPGPICYGRGGKIPTVTDANLVLGRLPVQGLRGGAMRLDAEAARHGVQDLAHRMGCANEGALKSMHVVVQGILDIVNIQMARALRVISVERGHDPRTCALVSFGGAGGLHACELARQLGIRRVLVPELASTLSAFGMLTADRVLDFSHTVMLPGETSWARLEELFNALVERGQREFRHGTAAGSSLTVIREMDVRYEGQSFELTVPYSPDYRRQFDRHHEARYAHHDTAAPIEIVTLRLRVISRVQPPHLQQKADRASDPRSAWIDDYDIVVEKEMLSVPAYDRIRLGAGHDLMGPCVIVQSDTTTFIGPGDRVHVDSWGNLVVNIAAWTGVGNDD